uniref:Uncharacterized protein n=1 Tax=Arundo donax TaxID=35708 RepID=A0A0A8Y7N1_ARUDO
MLKVNARK